MSDNLYFQLRKFIKDIKLQCPRLFYWGITVVGMIDCLIFHVVDLSLQTPIPWRLSWYHGPTSNHLVSINYQVWSQRPIKNKKDIVFRKFKSFRSISQEQGSKVKHLFWTSSNSFLHIEWMSIANVTERSHCKMLYFFLKKYSILQVDGNAYLGSKCWQCLRKREEILEQCFWVYKIRWDLIPMKKDRLAICWFTQVLVKDEVCEYKYWEIEWYGRSL